MEQTIMTNIVDAQSLDDLENVWRAAVPDIENLPEDQAAEIIQLKNERKAEIETGIYRRRMNSKVLGTVDVVFDTHKPDSAEVEGVPYSKTELDTLISKSLDRERLLEVHRVKKSFKGTVNP